MNPSHREMVRRATDSLHSAVADRLAPVGLVALEHHERIMVDLVQPSVKIDGEVAALSSLPLADIQHSYSAHLKSHKVSSEDVLSCTIELTPNSWCEMARCPVADGPTAERRLIVTRLLGRTTLVTRHVHMWRDWNVVERLPLG